MNDITFLVTSIFFNFDNDQIPISNRTFLNDQDQTLLSTTSIPIGCITNRVNVGH